jgi:hypothetical protein
LPTPQREQEVKSLYECKQQPIESNSISANYEKLSMQKFSHLLMVPLKPVINLHFGMYLRIFQKKIEMAPWYNQI